MKYKLRMLRHINFDKLNNIIKEISKKNNKSKIYIFFDMSLVKILLPLLIAVINFDKVYKLVMFVLRKIPFLGVD